MIKERRTADIRIKRAYDPPGREDGARVLVDRLWPRGLRKEDAALTLWLKEIAPTPELRKWFGHDPSRWAEFARRYNAELTDNKTSTVQLCNLARRGRVTLLYAAQDQHHNNAVALQAFLKNHLKDDHALHAP